LNCWPLELEFEEGSKIGQSLITTVCNLFPVSFKWSEWHHIDVSILDHYIDFQYSIYLKFVLYFFLSFLIFFKLITFTQLVFILILNYNCWKIYAYEFFIKLPAFLTLPVRSRHFAHLYLSVYHLTFFCKLRWAFLFEWLPLFSNTVGCSW